MPALSQRTASRLMFRRTLALHFAYSPGIGGRQF
jgi:hypothetical protein